MKPTLKPDRLVYVGLRDVDAGEKKILREQGMSTFLNSDLAYPLRPGIKAFSMHEVDKYGIGKVMEMALDHVNPNRDRPIHLTYE